MKFFIKHTDGSEIKTESTPKGKRSIRRNVYGNLNGFVSGKFWKTLGIEGSAYDEEQAALWQTGKID